ncbi:MAG TPA: glycosyltransferase family 2 protein [Microlunatus sp.]
MKKAEHRFVGPSDPAQVCVVIVTFHNADSIEALISSLRAAAATHRLRVIVADNASADATVSMVRRHPDVLLIETGGNLGYAGAINAASASIGSADTVLILNPDLTIEPGAIDAMLQRMQVSHAGAVVPRILNPDGSISPSLRREPSILRALGDAAMGAKVPRRPGFLSENIADPAAYTSPQPVDWATGAAILIDGEVAARVGPWDERFFLYSEETDYCRRIRVARKTIWFEPSAVVVHSQGGSGRSVDLDRLLAVNRVRYARKHLSPAAAATFRGAVVLHELVRSYAPAHRAILRSVVSERTWSSLPRARLSQDLPQSLHQAAP